MSQKSVRDKIVVLINAGVSNMEIMKHLKVCRKMVFNVMKRYIETATTINQPVPCRSRSVYTKSVAQAVKERLQQNPLQSMRKYAKHLQKSEKSVRRIMKENLGLMAYKK